MNVNHTFVSGCESEIQLLSIATVHVELSYIYHVTEVIFKPVKFAPQVKRQFGENQFEDGDKVGSE